MATRGPVDDIPSLATIEGFDAPAEFHGLVVGQVWTPGRGNLGALGSQNTDAGALRKLSRGLLALEAPGGVGYSSATYNSGRAIDAHATIAVIRRADTSFSSFYRHIVTVGNTGLGVHNNSALFQVTNASVAATVAPITSIDDWHVVVFRRINPTVEIFAALPGVAGYNYQSVGSASSARNWVPQGAVTVGCTATSAGHPYGAAALVYSLVGVVPDQIIRRCLEDPACIFEARRILVPVATGGSPTYTSTLTESTTAAEALSAALIAVAAQAETVVAADALTAAATLLAALTETTTAADALAALLTAVAAVAEPATAAELLSTGTQYGATLTEPASSAETLAAAATLVALLTEPATAADAQAAAYPATYSVSVAELATALEVLAAVLGSNATLAALSPDRARQLALIHQQRPPQIGGGRRPVQ